MDLRQTLQQHFGYTGFRAGQEQVIQALLAGRSSLAIFPTGGGKSLCYQLPALLLEGVTLVISPLIALMKNQVESLQQRGIPAARLDSSLTKAETTQVYDEMYSGRLKLLYVAPERLMNEGFMNKLERVKVSLMAIDEAHCISEWGHNFRPEYLRLAAVAKKLNLHPVLTLTATATPEVARDIAKAFNVADQDCVQTPFHRPNLAIYVSPTEARQRLAVLTAKLRKFRRFPAIIYVTLQHTAEHVATHLAKQGLNAMAYHAGLNSAHRSKVQEDFMRGEVDIIVATIAFGMGIDKADIRSVYHYNLPKTLENYQQEIGRAGRDGQPSHCEMLACADDLIVLQNFTFGDTPTPLAVEQLLQSVLRQGTEFDISHYDISRATDIRPLVLETVLTHLELAGILQPLGSFYSTYQVAFQENRERILAGHTPERRQFLAALFDTGKKGSKWLTLDVVDAEAQLGQPRERILKALNYLQEAGDIQLQAKGLRYRYRLTGDTKLHDPKALAEQMQDLFFEREQRDAERLEQVLALAADGDCLTRHLLSYFGEELEENCGHCGSCLVDGGKSRIIPQSPEPEISEVQLAMIQTVMKERHAALRSPRQLTRFLCGLSSPAASRDRLGQHDSFGLLENIPFMQVLEQVESMLGA
jgi:ATP-dependent DNA helicase RecQ